MEQQQIAMENGKKLRKRDKETILQQRRRRAENPKTVFIAPKTTEGHTLVKINFAFDRAISSIRYKAGIFVKLDEAIKSLEKSSEFVRKVNEFLVRIGDGQNFYSYEDPEIRRKLAEDLSVYLFEPKTNEAREMALLIKKIDPHLLQIRIASSDFTRSETIFKEVSEIIKDFDTLVLELSGVAQTKYERPWNLEAFLGMGINPESSGGFKKNRRAVSQ